MKKIAVAALLCLTALPALAQSAPPPAPPGSEAGGNGGGGQQRFEEIKAKILQRIQEREACVQAANDPEALRACAPPRGTHGGGERGPGGQQEGGQSQGQQGDGLPQ